MLTKAIVQLIRGSDELSGDLKEAAGRQFYAEIILKAKRHITTDIPTCGVNVKDGINLYINPYFWEALTTTEQVAILIHEIGHVMYNYWDRCQEIMPELEKQSEKRKNLTDVIKYMQENQITNQAHDYAINDEPGLKHILPKKFRIFNKDGTPAIDEETGKEVDAEPCTIEALQKMLPKVKVKNGQIMEYYYNLLKQKQKEDQKNGKGQTTIYMLDDHSLWCETDGNEQYVKEIIKQAVNSAAEEATRKAGTLPGNIQQLINKLCRKTKNWKQDLRKFVANTSETLKEETRRKRNRRYGTLYPGMKLTSKLHLAALLDCSGSVFDAYVEQFMAEIAKIHSENVTVTVIEFDTTVNSVYVFDPKKPVKVTGRGGTLFKPPFDKAAELDVDGIVVLTDGGCFDKPEKPRIPLLWALCKGDKKPFPWGWETEVELSEKGS